MVHRAVLGGSTSVGWGAPSLGDTPVVADYDGDGKADITVARQATGEWFIRGSLGVTTYSKWGLGDSRVAGDYSGNGRAAIAIFRAATGTWLVRP